MHIILYHITYTGGGWGRVRPYPTPSCNFRGADFKVKIPSVPLALKNFFLVWCCGGDEGDRPHQAFLSSPVGR